jgi:hypothetical protein
MTAQAHSRSDRAGERFVIAHGHRASGRELAFILHQPFADIERLRASGVCSKASEGKTFTDLFRLWHGRDPADEEWPAPSKVGGGFEWQAPELVLLASLVGTLGKDEITLILTERLRRITKNPTARRTRHSVQVAIGKIGLQATDVVGGITTTQAAKEIGSLAMVNQAIHKGDLRASRTGRLWVIPRKAWEAWKAKRVFPPAGYVPLASLKQALASRSDKLSEFARLGYVPTAVRCNPYGTGLHSTQFGTWYIDPGVAQRLIDDRHAGRPMPWHGKPLSDNLRVTYALWRERKHPEICKTCAGIWGAQGAPRSFETYAERYPPLPHGAKRHLTLRWNTGLTVAELARKAGCTTSRVRRAIGNGTVNALDPNGEATITRTDATRWISRGCPTGDTQKSWISIATAAKRYLFAERDIKRFIAEGRLKSKIGTEGAARSVVYVSWQQCAALRESIGFTEREAARRAGANVADFRAALAGVNWRGTGAIPLVTVQAVIKRLQSRPGYTIEQAAHALGQDTGWIEARIAGGTVRLLRRWDADRLYLSEPMMRRLRAAIGTPAAPVAFVEGALRLSEAAREAGVTTTTIIKWAEAGDIERVHAPSGWRYPLSAVRVRARRYWQHNRFKRATPPEWLRAESDSSSALESPAADHEGGRFHASAIARS